MQQSNEYRPTRSAIRVRGKKNKVGWRVLFINNKYNVVWLVGVRVNAGAGQTCSLPSQPLVAPATPLHAHFPGHLFDWAKISSNFLLCLELMRQNQHLHAVAPQIC